MIKTDQLLRSILEILLDQVTAREKKVPIELPVWTFFRGDDLCLHEIGCLRVRWDDSHLLDKNLKVFNGKFLLFQAEPTSFPAK